MTGDVVAYETHPDKRVCIIRELETWIPKVFTTQVTLKIPETGRTYTSFASVEERDDFVQVVGFPRSIHERLKWRQATLLFVPFSEDTEPLFVPRRKYVFTFHVYTS